MRRGGAFTARQTSSGTWAPVRRTALAKVVVMGGAGVFGLVDTRLIITRFGTEAYAQNGLLVTIPTLMPFTDYGYRCGHPQRGCRLKRPAP